MKGQKNGRYTDTESLSPDCPEVDPRNVPENQENLQSLLRQQVAKARAWFTLLIQRWFPLPERWY